MSLSKPNYLPRAPSPNIFPLGVRDSTYEFGGHKYIIYNKYSSLKDIFF
jgi:hypothetical protein